MFFRTRHLSNTGSDKQCDIVKEVEFFHIIDLPSVKWLLLNGGFVNVCLESAICWICGAALILEWQSKGLLCKRQGTHQCFGVGKKMADWDWGLIWPYWSQKLESEVQDQSCQVWRWCTSCLLLYSSASTSPCRLFVCTSYSLFKTILLKHASINPMIYILELSVTVT